MPKAGDLRKGQVVEIDGEPWSVKQVESKSPSSRGAATLYKVRFAHAKTRQKRDGSFKGEDFLKEADCQRVAVQYSYRDGDTFNFMNLDDYSQYSLDQSELEDQIGYLVDGLEGIYALLLDGEIAAIELPQAVDIKVVETDPAIKGASATGRTKPATLSTGLVIQVPEYLDADEVARVSTKDGKFVSRA
jgi:elongation factor P